MRAKWIVLARCPETREVVGYVCHTWHEAWETTDEVRNAGWEAECVPAGEQVPAGARWTMRLPGVDWDGWPD